MSFYLWKKINDEEGADPVPVAMSDTQVFLLNEYFIELNIQFQHQLTRMPYSCTLSSSVLVTKNPGHLKGVSRSLGKYRSSSSALSRSLQPANDEYESFDRIGDGE